MLPFFSSQLHGIIAIRENFEETERKKKQNVRRFFYKRRSRALRLKIAMVYFYFLFFHINRVTSFEVVSIIYIYIITNTTRISYDDTSLNVYISTVSKLVSPIFWPKILNTNFHLI